MKVKKNKNTHYLKLQKISTLEKSPITGLPLKSNQNLLNLTLNVLNLFFQGHKHTWPVPRMIAEASNFSTVQLVEHQVCDRKMEIGNEPVMINQSNMSKTGQY